MDHQNSDIQKDEISALESIYNEEEFSYYLEDDSYKVSFKIFIPLPENFYFTFKDNRKSREQMEKVPVSHLPPLILEADLPHDYPTNSAPKFKLKSSWLRHSSLTKLCVELDKLWENNKGQEILFTWIGFLQSETLNILNIQESVNINHSYTYYKSSLERNQEISKNDTDSPDVGERGPNTSEKQQNTSKQNRLTKRKSQGKKTFARIKNRRFLDQRAITEIDVGKNPVQLLVDYNEEREHTEFMKNCYTCMICFTDKLGKYCTQFLPCEHVFCKSCITSYLNVKIQEGTVQNISCPEIKCKSEASPGQIKDLLTPEQFSKYDSMLLNSTLDRMTDIIYCPRRDCQYPVSREPNEVMANCPVCHYAFCIYCKMVYHGIAPCKINSEEKMKLIKEYQEASAEKKKEFELRYGKKTMQNLVDNAMSENWISTNSQNCPECDSAIEKSDGCNKMTCLKCSTFFCWICRTVLKKDSPYNHYQDPSSKCFDKLFLGIEGNDRDDSDTDDDDEDYVFDPDDYTDTSDDDFVDV